jgi:16S rRNA (guanine527-N7)-methyltransferase
VSQISEFCELLCKAAAPFQRLTDAQSAALYRHYELMLRWNKVINLTRISELREAVERHYAESLFLAAQLPAGARTLVDIGSGAGFPGIPVAAVHPELAVTLVESDQRKAAFLREASDGLKNVAVIAHRAEELSESVDVVVSRAVKPQDVLKVAQRIARHALLLVSEADASKLDIPGSEAIPVPFPRGGVVLRFEVPRGTSG